MPNDTRTGLKNSNKRFYRGMNPPQNLDFNIIEEVWDHLYRERNKGSQHPNTNHGILFKNPEELFLKTT